MKISGVHFFTREPELSQLQSASQDCFRIFFVTTTPSSSILNSPRITSSLNVLVCSIACSRGYAFVAICLVGSKRSKQVENILQDGYERKTQSGDGGYGTAKWIQ